MSDSGESMNHYAQRLQALQHQPDHQLKEIGDQWQTPKPLAWGLFHHFAPKIGPVVIDLFADHSNAMVGNYYTAEDNALLQDWAGDARRQGGACFGNPPYSRPELDADGNPITGMDNILAYCRAQREQGAKIMLFIKAATSEGWWPEDADFIQFVSGRVGFEVPNWYVPRDPKKDKPSSSGFASAVVIFDRDWKWERRPAERLVRADLVTTGEIILGMIHQRAAELLVDIQPVTHSEVTAGSTETVDNQAQEAASQPSVEQPEQAETSTTQGPQADVTDMPQPSGNHCQLPDAEPSTTLTGAELTELDQQYANTKPLADWYWDYQHGDSLSLPNGQWTRFVVVLTILYGIKPAYTSRQVANAISICDEQLMDEYTTLDEPTKERIRRTCMAMEETKKHMPMMSNADRQLAVTALLERIDNTSLPLFEAIKIMMDAVRSSQRQEVDA